MQHESKRCQTGTWAGQSGTKRAWKGEQGLDKDDSETRHCTAALRCGINIVDNRTVHPSCIQPASFILHLTIRFLFPTSGSPSRGECHRTTIERPDVNEEKQDPTARMQSLLKSFIPPLVFCLGIPLAAFACLTALFAFWVLMLRASIVYLEVGLSLLQTALQGPLDDTKSTTTVMMRMNSHSDSAPALIPPQPVAENGSRRSLTSGFITPLPLRTTFSPSWSGPERTAQTVTSPVRDFESVGGWRLANDADEEALWLSLNSRLELPAATMSGIARNRHGQQPSLTSSPVYDCSRAVSRAATPRPASPETTSLPWDVVTIGMQRVEGAVRARSKSRPRPLDREK